MNAFFGHQRRPGLAFTGNLITRLDERTGSKEYRWRGQKVQDGRAVARHSDFSVPSNAVIVDILLPSIMISG